MKNAAIVILFSLLLIPGTISLFANDPPNGIGYFTAGKHVERPTPAGTIREPGSQLLFILDTGYNPLFLAEDDGYRTRSIKELEGVFTPHYLNWISITNTTPRYSVTLHFQYYNCYMEPILDFLMVMSCQDTMMVDALNLVIPGSGGINVKERFFQGRDQLEPGQSIPSVSASEFGDGRFLLSVTAVGDPKGLEAGSTASVYDPYWDGNRETLDPDYENIDLFPAELVTWDELQQECPAYSGGEVPEDVIGDTPGINDDNLHIFNATAISFNYLVGFQTVACVGPHCNQSYIVDAFTRPARNRDDALEENPEFRIGREVPPGLVLSGGERIYHQLRATPFSSFVKNNYYLKWESGSQINDGRPMSVDFESDYENDLLIHSQGGSINWSLMPIAWTGMSGFVPPAQHLNLLSLGDDYNGSNATRDPVFPFRSYSLSPLVSVYLLTLFNDSEDYLEADNPEEFIDPVPTDYPLTVPVAVRGMNAWSLEGQLVNARLDQNLYRFGVDDIYRLRGEDVIAFLPESGAPVFEKGPNSDGTSYSVENSPPAGTSGYESEIGPGWVRLTRLFVTGIWERSDSWLKKGTFFDGDFPSAITVSQHISMFRGIGYGIWSSASGYDEERINRLLPELLDAAADDQP